MEYVTALAAILVYMVPTFISVGRKHKSVLAIVAVNVLGGWTVIGWFWAFIWSLTGNIKEK